MSSLWRKRALRAWLLLLLPLAGFFCYQAISAHFEADRAQEYAGTWHKRDLEQERAGISKGTFSIDPKQQMRESYEWKYAAIDRRDNAIAWATIILALPLAVGLGFRAAGWIWIDATQLAKIESTQATGAKASKLRWILKGVAFATPAAIAVGFMLYFAPQKTVSILVSSVIQVVGAVLLVWIVRNLKR